MKRAILVAVLILVPVLRPVHGLCSTDVAASIFPISAIVREIGGSRVKVTTVVPAGSDPHHFELTPKRARALNEADILFIVGGDFDRWIVSKRFRDSERGVLIEFHEAFPDSLIPIGDTFNPHFWLDPLIAKAMGTLVARTLCAVDTAGCAHYEAGAREFLAKVDSLHSIFKMRLEESGLRGFVASHPAWSYFARRYGLKEYSTIEISHEQEPSARHIAGVVRSIRTNGIRFILAEEFSNLDLARAIAAETGARIIVLDPLGGDDKAGRDSYLGLIDYNISVIAASVKDRKGGQNP
jgi:zinc transport system substrate-binding protein